MPFQPFAYDWDRVQVTGGERWKWLAVEIAEIRRCAGVGDQAHDRLALLLTDHLVEVIVGREVNARLAWQFADSVVEEMREIRDSGAELSAESDKMIDEHVGSEERQRLDEHLHEKTRYLVKHGVLTSQERDVLGRMHEYRNAAYHRDTLDAGLISDLVLAYMMLASQLLARHRPMMPIAGLPVASSEIAWMIGTSDPVTPGKLSCLLTAGVEIDLKGMAGRFSDHALKRVNDIARAVSIARVILHVATDDAQEQDESIPDDDFAHLLTTLNGVAPAQLQSWTKRASELKINIKSLENLMIRYINLDRVLCKIEPSARCLAIIWERWEEDLLDEIRLK